MYRVIFQGKRNGGPGPDYLGAELAFPDGSIRRGDVEIHLQNLDWYRHRHRWDPRYREVILHVIASGTSDDDVFQDEWRAIPTVPLPGDPTPFMPPCETSVQPLRRFQPDQQEDFLKILATQRWWSRLADMQRAQGEWWMSQALARRVGTDRHRLELIKRWMALLPKSDTLGSFIFAIMSSLNLDRKTKCMRGLPGRVTYLSALVFMHKRSPGKLWTWTLDDMHGLLQEVEQAGFPVPTKSFVIEVAGNWFLPISQLETNRDHFPEWYGMPLGWRYGRVSRHIHRLGLQSPTTFGQQQGLLEWIESLCQEMDCTFCPVMEAVGDFS